MPIPLVYLHIKIYLYIISQGSSRSLSFHKGMVSGILIPGKLHSKFISDGKSHKQRTINNNSRKPPMSYVA